MLQQCNVVNLRMLVTVLCGVDTSQYAQSANNLGVRIFVFPQFSLHFAYILSVPPIQRSGFNPQFSDVNSLHA